MSLRDALTHWRVARAAARDEHDFHNNPDRRFDVSHRWLQELLQQCGDEIQAARHELDQAELGPISPDDHPREAS